MLPVPSLLVFFTPYGFPLLVFKAIGRHVQPRRRGRHTGRPTRMRGDKPSPGGELDPLITRKSGAVPMESLPAGDTVLPRTGKEENRGTDTREVCA